MAKILCIDASTEACSVALLNGQEQTERFQLAPRQHAQLLLPMVAEILADSEIQLNQLDAICCLVGPGAFTGIRIGVSIAQGLAFGADLPTISESSLANLAQQALNESKADICYSVIDARMQEVYFGIYQVGSNGLAALVDEEQVISPQLINFTGLNELPNSKQLVTIGSGWTLCESAFVNHVQANPLFLADRYPRAIASLSIAAEKLNNGQVLSPEQLQPTYLRNDVAKKKLVKE